MTKDVPLRETAPGASLTVPEDGTQAATRVADVLLAIAVSDGGLGVSEASRRTGLSKAVVHRILRSLESRRLVRLVESSGTYELGSAAAALGRRALSDHDLRVVALPVLRQLQQRSGETTTVSALAGTARIYLDQVVSDREIKMMVPVGRAFPLHAGSSSKAILAFAPLPLRQFVLDGALAAFTNATIVERRQLEAELERIVRAGIAMSRGERQADAGSVAAPVFAADSQVIGSISVCGPLERFSDEVMARLTPLVRAAAAQVSAALRGVLDGDVVP